MSIQHDFKEWQKQKHVAVYAAYFALLMSELRSRRAMDQVTAGEVQTMKDEAWRVADLQQEGEA